MKGAEDMSKRALLISTIVGVALLLVVAGIYAKTVPDVIELKDPAYEKHKKGIVQFEHEKHQAEYAEKYPDLYPNGCGDCHHDAEGKPLVDLKEGDPVQRCIECHKIPGEMPKKDLQALKKDVRAKKLTEEELLSKKLAYHAEAFHENCRVCHKAYNKKYKPEKKAPTTCTKCHPKKKN
jgi:hypothetical protein